jgi:hypothetical protein
LKRASTKLERVLVAWHVTRPCPAKGDPGHLSKTKSPADATRRAAAGRPVSGERHKPLAGEPVRRSGLAERAPRRSARRVERRRGDDGLAMGARRRLSSGI